MMSSLVPKLRFDGFSGEWEENNLGDIVTIFKGKGIPKSDIAKDGVLECIRYGELYTEYREIIKDIKSKTNLNTANLILSKKNDVIIPSSGETYLDIATASCVVKDNIALGGDLNILRGNENGIFLAYYLSHAKKYDIAKLAQGIAVVHLYSSQLIQLNLSIPKPKEQQKIANCLSSLDNLIESQNKKVKALEKHKKGLMQNLFPKDADKEPKLRFDGFSGEWEGKKLRNCLDYLQPTKYLVKSTDYDDSYKTPVLTAGKTFILGYTDEINGIFSDNLPVIIFDDFTTASKFVNFSFKAKSSAMKILLSKDKIDIKFMYEVMQLLKYQVETHQRHWISHFAELNVFIPKYEEQQKIANCFSSLDKLIEAQNKKIKTLEQHKKGLMQQLFVHSEH